MKHVIIIDYKSHKVLRQAYSIFICKSVLLVVKLTGELNATSFTALISCPT